MSKRKRWSKRKGGRRERGVEERDTGRAQDKLSKREKREGGREEYDNM